MSTPKVNPTAALYYRTLANIEKHSPKPDVKALDGPSGPDAYGVYGF